MANPQSPPPSPSVSRIDWRRVAASPWTIGLAVPAACLLRSHAYSLQRTFLGVEVESDFTGSFAREAQRILVGSSPGTAQLTRLAIRSSWRWGAFCLANGSMLPSGYPEFRQPLS